MINNYLQSHQLEQVFALLYKGKAVTVLRFIRHAGRSRVPWIYIGFGGSCRATFVSFRELLQAYYRWLANLDLFHTRLDERKAIGRANWHLMSVGDQVFSVHANRKEIGTIIEKARHNYLPILWIDWGTGTPISEMPWSVEVF